ncbi:MAG: YggS family pyridoxal phosphate-dependent enzyme, partial [Gemmatimonadota bacterium]
SDSETASRVSAELDGRLEGVRARLRAAAERSNRDPGTVSILPVTKGFPASVVRLVAAAGLGAVGENRVGEAEAKQAELGESVDGLRWHMIGHLQRNKAARAVELFDRIDSVDSLRLARRLQKSAERADREDLEVLVQVNASGEASKGGFPVADAVGPVREICGLARLRVLGLMTMAPLGAGEAELRRVFGRTRRCLEACRERIAGFEGTELSMGMSGDFEIAVEEGATQVRLGTALLGERPG